MSPTFDFTLKHFGLNHLQSSMKVSTDSILLGSLCDCNDSKFVLDIGTGCGILALMIAQKSEANIVAIDIDSSSIKEASFNFCHSPWGDRITAKEQNLSEFTNQTITKFDLIITNPPYFDEKTTSPNAQRNQARNEQSLSFEELIKSVKQLLSEDGSFWIILPPTQFQKFAFEATSSLLRCYQRINISHNQNEPPVLIVSHWKHIFPSQSHSIQTLYIFDSNHNYSIDFKEITKDFYFDI
ncbi:MAG: methyltransferase [Bacteroidota bacterium]